MKLRKPLLLVISIYFFLFSFCFEGQSHARELLPAERDQIQAFLTQIRLPLERFKSLLSAIASEDLGSADHLYLARHGQAVFLGYSVRGGVGIRRSVHQVYPLIMLSGHFTEGLGASVTVGTVLDRRSARQWLEKTEETDGVDADFFELLVEEEIDPISGSNPAHNTSALDEAQSIHAQELLARVRSAELAGSLVPKWQFWRRGQQIDALNLSGADDVDFLTQGDRYGQVRSGRGIGIATLANEDTWGLRLTLPLPFAARENRSVRGAFERSFSILSHFAQLARSGEILKPDGAAIARILINDFGLAVTALDGAVRNSSSHRGYAGIAPAAAVRPNSIFSSPEFLMDQQAMGHSRLEQVAFVPKDLRPTACDILLAL